LGKVVRSIESIDGSTDLTDGNGNSVIYIGREVRKGETTILQFDVASGELQHRAADGSGFIPIESYAEFQLINRDNTNRSKNYKQEANLDLLGDQNGDGTFGETGDQNWTPVGTYLSNAFTGTFNGDGKDIANLYIQLPISFIGLFGYVKGKIKNVHIQSGSLTGSDAVGGISGGLHVGGTIENCSNAGTVRGEWVVGGVVGRSDSSGSITACSNTGPVIGTARDVGGITGFNAGSITACSNAGKIEALFIVGGVAGYNEGSITACSNTGPVTSPLDAGGVVTYNYGSITACYNVGLVFEQAGQCGSIVKENGNQIIACYWLPGGAAIDASFDGSYSSPQFSLGNWPNSSINTNWDIGSANGSPGNYWKSMGTPSNSPGPNDFPKLWWE
jgi:hypothetical protein